MTRITHDIANESRAIDFKTQTTSFRLRRITLRYIGLWAMLVGCVALPFIVGVYVTLGILEGGRAPWVASLLGMCMLIATATLLLIGLVPGILSGIEKVSKGYAALTKNQVGDTMHWFRPIPYMTFFGGMGIAFLFRIDWIVLSDQVLFVLLSIFIGLIVADWLINRRLNRE